MTSTEWVEHMEKSKVLLEMKFVKLNDLLAVSFEMYGSTCQWNKKKSTEAVFYTSIHDYIEVKGICIWNDYIVLWRTLNIAA